MAQLSTKVKAYVEAAGKTVDFTKDVILQDDSKGQDRTSRNGISQG